MRKTHFLTVAKGPDPGLAYLEGSYADMAAYPPKGLGHKYGFRIFDQIEGETPHDTAQRILADPASPVFEVHAPAGCVPLGEDEYLFFGRIPTPCSNAA